MRGSGRLAGALLLLAAGCAPADAMADDHASHPVSTDPGHPTTHAPSHRHAAATVVGVPPRQPLPELTDADRAAAFPDVGAHAMHGTGIAGYMLVDRLETTAFPSDTGLAWDATGWLGGDLDRVWLRSEGGLGGNDESARAELLYGRALGPWWDVVAGVRHDLAPGRSRSFAAIGIQGLAPQMFEVAATAYVGAHGRAALELEVAYEFLVSNRLVLQPTLELAARARDDGDDVGFGWGRAEAGLRMRYEVTRQFAPYIGIVHERAFGGDGDAADLDGGHADGTRWVLGLRLWF